MFKYIEINSSGQNSARYIPQQTSDKFLLVSYFFIYLVIIDLTSGQNTENSIQADTSEKLFNIAGGPLLLAELVS